MIRTPEVLRALQRPLVISEWSADEWDRCIRQAHRGNLTCRLDEALTRSEVLDQVPPPVRPHLQAARVLVDKHRRDVAYEVRCIEDALRPLGIPVLLLKGAAYVAADLALARNRMFHDVDIMVPHAQLAAVERRLRNAGWSSANPDSYDQSYYRRWSHELPPLVHAFRGTTLDVHHTILPPTATPVPDPDKLMAAARRVSGRVKVLEPVDMFLHSATHLFHEGEFDHGLRDLMDLRDPAGMFRARGGVLATPCPPRPRVRPRAYPASRVAPGRGVLWLRACADHEHRGRDGARRRVE